MAKAITFNGFSLQDSNWRTKDIIYRNYPGRTVDLEPLSRRDGFRFVNSYYTTKEIRITGSVTADTESALRTLVDNMKKALNGTEKALTIDDGGSNVQWTGTVVSIDIPEEHFHITRVPYSIIFRCQPFGIATSTSSNTNSITNTASESSSIVIAGSAAPRPVITWTVSGTPTTTITGISFVNSTTGDTFGVTGLSLSGSGDYLELDTENMTVVYNTGSGEVDIDFTGVIPTFVTSTNSYSITITGGGASKTLVQRIVYSASYL